MENYVTLFDSLFLPQGLALYDSLEKHGGDFTLWIVCMNEKCFHVLDKLKLQNAKLLQLSKIETPELLSVKSGRSIAEYCWTITSSTPKFVFDADDSVDRVTYIDADLWFRRSPLPIFREFELSGKSVLITEHAYSPEFDESQRTGRFCVQFMTFKRGKSEIVRKWWQDRCIEWCFARFEDGKFGDQKYLDDWDERFDNQVHILQNQQWSLAPWNASRFPFSSSIFYHFHGLRIMKNKIKFDGYPLPKSVIKNVYVPYINVLRRQIEILKEIGFDFKPQAKPPDLFRVAKRIYMGIYLQIWRFNNRHTIR